VQPENSLGPGIVEHAFLYHNAGAAGVAFLAGLEHQFYGAFPLVFQLIQYFGGAQEHRGMHIMAAGMHDAIVLRLIINLVFFFNGEGVHIGPEGNGTLAGIIAFDKPYHAGSSHYFKGDTHAGQLLLNEGGGIEFLVTEFRVGMEMTTDSDKIGGILFGQLPDLVPEHKLD